MQRNPSRLFGRSVVRSFVFVIAFVTTATAALAQSAPERKELNIGVGPDWGTSGHAVIAFHKGYFKDQGFTQINFKSFAAGLMQVEAMAAGAIDIVNPAQGPILTLRSNGVPVVVLASLAAYHDSLALVVRKTANVRDPKQLEGLKIGTLKGTSAEQMVLAIARQYGVDAAKIQLVNLAPPEQLASLATGAIDGICVWQPWVHQATQKVAVDILHTGATSAFERNKGERRRVDSTRGILASTERFVKANPLTVDALLRAYAAAQTFVSDPKNYAEVVTIFSKHHNQDAELNKVLLKEYSSSLALDDAYLADMNSVQDFLAASGRLRNKVTVQAMTHGAPLAKIDSKLVTITSP